MFHIVFEIFFLWFIISSVVGEWIHQKNPAKSLWFSCLALMGLFVCGISLFFLILSGNLGRIISYIGSLPILLLIIIALIIGERNRPQKK